ncbi:MAG: FAD-dependent oxidoreductase [Candidatus Nanopelagicales bacterium]
MTDFGNMTTNGVPLAEKCDVCIVGAGFAGINALFVASRYLSRDQRVILVDSRQRVGGMWVDTYSYVRLHQPHPMFTAGNIPWAWDRPPGHLSSKSEVLDHFQHCLETIKKTVRVDEFFGWTVESDTETDVGVQVNCRSTDGREMRIDAKKLIKAYGAHVVPNDPLPVSSPEVRSVSPDTCDMRGSPIADDDRPVWVIGGGKTAMDTVHALVTAKPHREVNLMAGSGTYFSNRDVFYPNGIRRWWSGTMVNDLAGQVTARFDGTNEDAVSDWYRSTYGLWCTPKTGDFLLGLLSADENETITAGLSQAVNDHFVDVVQTSNGPHMTLRSGASIPVEAGSWIVNCTGYIAVHDHPYEPYCSPGGKVLSIQLRSSTMHLPSYMAYFSTHLLFSGKLREVPLYELDWPDLRQKSPRAIVPTLFTLAQHNLSLCADNLPMKAFRELGLDFDRWFPLPRRLVATAKFMTSHRRDRDRLRGVLDTVHDRFDVRCGPLPAQQHAVR